MCVCVYNQSPFMIVILLTILRQTVKCCQPSSVKCTQTCEKVLNCGRHQCQQLCHQGQCEPCDVEITQG